MRSFYQKAVTVLILIACSLFICGVDACNISTKIKIIGTWNNGEIELVFSSNGNYQGCSQNGCETNGTYTITGNEIKLVDNNCGSVEGVYEITITEDELTFTLISDLCEGRGSVLPGTWTKASLLYPES